MNGGEITSLTVLEQSVTLVFGNLTLDCFPYLREDILEYCERSSREHVPISSQFQLGNFIVKSFISGSGSRSDPWTIFTFKTSGAVRMP